MSAAVVGIIVRRFGEYEFRESLLLLMGVAFYFCMAVTGAVFSTLDPFVRGKNGLRVYCLGLRFKSILIWPYLLLLASALIKSGW